MWKNEEAIRKHPSICSFWAVEENKLEIKVTGVLYEKGGNEGGMGTRLGLRTVWHILSYRTFKTIVTFHIPQKINP